MAGEEKFGYFRLSEGTEGEDGSLSSGCSWLEVLCEWRWKLTTDCSSFVCEKSGKVISCYRCGGRWWRRRELNVLKRLRISGALLILLWKCDDLAVWTSAEKDECNDWYILRSDGSFDFCHFLSAALPSQRTSDNQGLEGAVCVNPWTGAWQSHASAYGFTAKETVWVNVDLKESDLALFTHRTKLGI